ncbi:hypothetical protein AAEU31_18370 [Pseudoalteromonas sp. SSMSWG5]|jgi:hypothetical protein|uniref:hypothetical protein n=1 Tax=Pseudoalteromonas TaxID=53246 RepID=UPI000C3504E9|nr:MULTISPECIES: hypothetical protein [unclassified Pseudoalteromonas]MBD55604.1 hypothetical protein [Pseudoalteromonas sp.]MBU76148.1 hypothetical protein [Pseudoalteromonadaceae bacterium]MCF2920271.1 hypothetical protein [Pseudoalteromonas sp. APAL1]TGV20884.1 hypothetical protein E5N72_12715 [Pseudoalteromonas sp. MEBiC 03607]HCV05493.1 hypothetical protein [Pseudoalteromonas sp.]|tara:strand:- start:469 stop:888 length:420 start_codon:yes stop_codon:yes gene_type:complete
MIKNKQFTITLTLCAALVTLASQASQAPHDCQLTSNNTEETKRYIQCLDQVISDLQRDQKMWVNKLTMDIEKIKEDTGNSQLLPIFKRSLVNQERYLEDSCRWRYLNEMPNATKAAITYKLCEINILGNHLNILKQPLK